MDEDRQASFVELFFDLVFVFGITQIVAFVHGHLDWATLGKAAIVLLLLWWAWTNFTWSAGYADFDDVGPRIVLLIATALTFILATAVQGAYGDDGGIFGMAYLGVMALVTGFFLFRMRGSEEMAGFLAYSPRILAGAVVVLIGGFLSADVRPWVWLAAVVINVVATGAVESNEYRINASHFAERHGLFVIIVLGEVLIASGLGIVGQDFTAEFYVAGTAMLVVTLTMWWSYFDWISSFGEEKLKRTFGVAKGQLARNAYSFAHYPLVAGVVLFAIGTEELLAHPGDPFDTATRWAFIGGLMMFLASQSVMVRLFGGGFPLERLVLISLLGAVGVVFAGLSAAIMGAIVCGVLVATLGIETYRHIEDLRELRARQGNRVPSVGGL